jgi:hypothetical protein
VVVRLIEGSLVVWIPSSDGLFEARNVGEDEGVTGPRFNVSSLLWKVCRCPFSCKGNEG